MSYREPSVSLEDFDISCFLNDAFSPTLPPPPASEERSLLIPLSELLSDDDCDPHRLKRRSEARRKASRRSTHQSVSGGYLSAVGLSDAFTTGKPSLSPATMTTFLTGRRAAMPRPSVVPYQYSHRISPAADNESANYLLSPLRGGVPGSTLVKSISAAAQQGATLSVATKPQRKISVRQSDAVTDALDLLYGNANTQNRWQYAVEIVDE